MVGSALDVGAFEVQAPPLTLAVDIEKLTEGLDADSPTGRRVINPEHGQQAGSSPPSRRNTQAESPRRNAGETL